MQNKKQIIIEGALVITCSFTGEYIEGNLRAHRDEYLF